MSLSKSSTAHGRRLRLSAAVSLLAFAGSLVLLQSAAGAASARSHRHRHRHHRPHPQAVVGPANLAPGYMVDVVVAGGRGGPEDPGDDYPPALKFRPQDSVFDHWLEYNRECTSFVAWALWSRNGFSMPFNDNAKGWGSRAAALGYAVNSAPAPGSVAWSTAGRYGHVAYVEAVNGGSVYIEEYNHFGNGTYDARTVPASTFTGYIHFKDVPQAPQAPAPESHPVVEVPAPPSTGGGSQPPVLTPPPPATYSEQETPNHPVNTFQNYHNASGEGPAIGSGAWVQVTCKVYDPTILSVDPDGYWYRIQSSPWNGAYYAPANTFMNGDPYGGPYTHNTDFAVPNC
jgi:surface antigen